MKIYLMTAAGVIFISVIVSLIIPEGKLNKSITFIMRLICITVLIQPITGIFDIGNTKAPTDFFDYQYVSSVYSEHQSTQMEKLLKSEFNVENECVVTVEYIEGEFKVTGTQITLEKNNKEIFEEIYSYLSELGYINITVYAQST